MLVEGKRIFPESFSFVFVHHHKMRSITTVVSRPAPKCCPSREEEAWFSASSFSSRTWRKSLMRALRLETVRVDLKAIAEPRGN